MNIIRKASAKWQGGLKEGKGEISTETGAISAYPYGFASRFEGKRGTNPEELLGAAHAGCFTMALSLMLGEANYIATQLDTTAEVTLAKEGEGFAVTRIDLKLRAKIPDIDQEQFTKIADKAKENCPLSKVLKAEITLEATLL